MKNNLALTLMHGSLCLKKFEEVMAKRGQKSLEKMSPDLTLRHTSFQLCATKHFPPTHASFESDQKRGEYCPEVPSQVHNTVRD